MLVVTESEQFMLYVHGLCIMVTYVYCCLTFGMLGLHNYDSMHTLVRPTINRQFHVYEMIQDMSKCRDFSLPSHTGQQWSK